MNQGHLCESLVIALPLLPRRWTPTGILRSPRIINDPHSAWHSVLLADAMTQAGAKATCLIGSEVGQDAQADHAAILKFLERTLNLCCDRQPSVNPTASEPAAGASESAPRQ